MKDKLEKQQPDQDDPKAKPEGAEPREELSDSDLEQISGGGDGSGSSTWRPF